MRHVLAIDPGTTESAWVLLEEVAPLPKIIRFGKAPNEQVIEEIDRLALSEWQTDVVIEMVSSYGMPVGEEVFTTVVWIGRFWERALRWGHPVTRIKRLAVKMAMCKSSKANDGAIRQRIIDLYGPGKDVAVGTKHAPGPLYGITGDAWQALALGLTFLQTTGMHLAAG
jgi:hypothetical protein